MDRPHGSGQGILSTKTGRLEGAAVVRFVPKADIAERRAVSCKAAVGAGITRPALFHLLDRTSSGAFVWHRGFLEARQPT